MQEQAEKWAEAKQFSDAVHAQLQAIALMERELIPNREEIVRSYLAITKYFRKDGQLDSVYVYLQIARQKGEKWLEPDDPVLSDVYNSFGIYYYYQGNCQEALQYYKLALERRLMCYGRWNPRIADAYNNLAICYDMLGMHKDAIEHYQEALTIRLQLFDECSPPVAECYLNMGVGYHYMSDYDKALEFYEKALSIWEETLPPDSPDFALIYNNMGVCYQNKGDYRRAQEILEKSLQNSINAYGVDHFEVANAYNNLGLNFYDQGDFSKALIFFEKALTIRRKNFEENHPLIASLYNNIGNCYRYKKDYAKALSYCRRALEMRLQIFGPDHREVADSYNDLGLYYETVGDYTQALFHYEKALEIDRHSGGTGSAFLPDSYLRMGRCYLNLGDLEQARSYFNKALRIKKASLGTEHPEVAEIFTELARSYPDDLQTGLTYIDLALLALRMNQATKINQVQLTAPLQVLSTLNVEGEIQLSLYRQTGEGQWLQDAHSTFQMARRVVERTRRSYQEPGSKQLLLDQFFEIYEHSIETDRLLNELSGDAKYLEEALIISENSKNVLLNEAVQKAHADQFAGIPPALVQQESDLLIDISFYETQLFAEEQKEKKADPRLLELFQDKVFERKSAYYSLLDVIAQQYPEYYELRYGKVDFSLVKLQARLAPERETLLEYFLGDEQLFLFIVTPDTILIQTQASGSYLSGLVRDLRRQISIFDPLTSDPATARADFAKAAVPLYNLLVAPAVPFIGSNALVIVPDGLLGYLPFECLLTHEPDNNGSWKNLPYLIYDYQISYQYAAGLLVTGRPDSDLPLRARILALAPKFGPGQQALHYNQEEVKLLRRRMPGRFLLGAEATEEHFRTYADQYRVIHLATHAQANDTIGALSYLVFSPAADSLGSEFLYLRDLYNMHLNADMVVLSACETGMGEWQRGEGIVSLGRGFLYAGAKSIVTTLWSIDDQPSSLIMEGFYDRLKNGLPKDQALREAKLEYLEENSALRAHPLFWAAFIPLGDMQAVAFQEKGSYWMIRGLACLVALLLGVSMFRWFRKPTSKTKA
ncbi:MAG: tetratricopeptide repeat protein [Lewinellaceae bacterium]|nr:tetratricopeptide repeat protein [Lewinellaceae bacterium]